MPHTARLIGMPHIACLACLLGQALVELGRFRDARLRLSDVLRVSKNGKNVDASKMFADIEGKEDFKPARATPNLGAGAKAARRALVREDRAQRMRVQEVNEQLLARCEHFSVLHRPYDGLRMHYELHAKPDFVLYHNIDFALLGQGLVLALNNLKKEEALRKDATVLPAAARVWAMGVQVLTDIGLPIDMSPAERLMWSPQLREIQMDDHFFQRTIRPLTKPATALSFDLRASAPRIKREEKFELEMNTVNEGKCNAIVFWYELHMGQHGMITSAPSVAAAPGATRISVGQALQYLPPKAVAAGQLLPVIASHNRSRIHFAHRDLPPPAPRRGLVVSSQLQVSQDGHFNRTFAAALRKAIFSHPKTRGVLTIHVGAGVGTMSIVAASARPECPDHVIACEKSADLIGVAEACARHNDLSGRISFLQKDARNLVAVRALHRFSLRNPPLTLAGALHERVPSTPTPPPAGGA